MRPSAFMLDFRRICDGPRTSVSIASQSIDYTKLRQDFVRAVARLCPGWLSSQRDDLVQAAVMRVMHIVSKQTGGPEGEAGVRIVIPVQSCA